MNVSAVTVVEPGQTMGRKVLIATKDFEPGEVIYKVSPPTFFDPI
jgi:hypothetical protein